MCLLLAAGCARGGFTPPPDELTGDAESPGGGGDGGPNGDTAFAAPARFVVGSLTVIPSCGTHASCSSYAPFGLDAGDLDGDGWPDLVSGQNEIISVLHNLGDGSFAVIADYDMRWEGLAIEIGDYDLDGARDVAAVSWNSLDVKLFWGHGDGLLDAAVEYNGASTPMDLVSADVDGDGQLDLFVVGENNRCNLLMGEAGRSFAAPVQIFNNGDNLYSVATGDLNGDGWLDVAFSNYSDAIIVLTGDGTATGWTPQTIGTDDWPHGILFQDLDGDGRDDLAAALERSDELLVLLNSGAGGGAGLHPVRYAAGPWPAWLASGDLNGDGVVDLAMSYGEEPLVSVFLGHGDGTFAARQDIALAPEATGSSYFEAIKLVTADLDGDGRLDIAAASPAAEGIAVIINGTP